MQGKKQKTRIQRSCDFIYKQLYSNYEKSICIQCCSTLYQLCYIPTNSSGWQTIEKHVSETLEDNKEILASFFFLFFDILSLSALLIVADESDSIDLKSQLYDHA